MADSDEEAQWRKEFAKDGVDALWRVQDTLPEPKRQFALRWLREKERAREAREDASHCYLKWTFAAAVAAVIVGIIGVAVTFWH